MNPLIGVAWATALALGAVVSAAPAPPCAPMRCSCVSYRSLSEQRDAAREVFVGTVVAMRDTSIRSDPRSRFELPARVVRLAVRARWKGAPADTTEVWTFTDGGMCAVRFDVGEEWLVLVESADRRVWGGDRGCSRTLRTDQARDELRELGAPLGASGPRDGR